MSDEPTLPEPDSDPNAETELSPRALFNEAAKEVSPTVEHPGWEPPEPEELDALLPAFKVEKLLGRGGMGAVYRAKQISLNRKVAIKVLPPEFGRDEAFAARFKREAHALAELKHPNIVDIYDFGQTGGAEGDDEDGYYYFVMEFVDGMDFHQLIHAKKLDIPGALNAVSQICDALAYAHSKGYIHRDIKPANIFLNYEGQVKVGDFGLAKLVTPGEAEANASAAAGPEPGLTITGTAMGTPFYSAPEQLRGMGEVDQRADIYSLGVMFYEMLTGKIPQGAFDPPSKKVAIDVRVDEVVLKAMAEEPERRYETAVELRTDVDAIRTASDVDVAELATIPTEEDSAAAGEGVGSLATSATKQREAKGPKKALWIAVAFIVVIAAAVVAVVVGDFGKPEGPGAGAADGGGSTTNPSADPDSIFPLPLPEFPPKRPEGAGRIIFVPVTKSPAPPPDWFSKISESDLSDVVRISVAPGYSGSSQQHLIAVRNNGSIATFSAGHFPHLDQLRLNFSGNAVSASKSIYQLIPVLGSDGSLWFSKPSKDPVPTVRRDGVTMIGEGNGLCIALYRDGSAEAWGGGGSSGKHSKRAEMLNRLLSGQEFVQVASTDERGAGFALRADGRLIGVAESNAQSRDVSMRAGSIAAIAEKGILAITPSGELLRLIGSEAEWAIVPNVPKVDPLTSRYFCGSLNLDDGSAGGRALAVIEKDGDVILCLNADFGRREPHLEKAFEDALDFGFFRDYIIAVLPADTVSRSGYWEVDDLIADRQQLLARRDDTPVVREAKPDELDATDRSPFPLPLPEFPPKRPKVECRLVAVSLNPENLDLPDWLRDVESEDIADFVTLSELYAGREQTVIGVRSNGAPIGWGDGSADDKSRRYANSDVVSLAYGNPTFLLTEEGIARPLNAAALNPLFSLRVPDAVNVEAVSTGTAVVLTKAGVVRCYGELDWLDGQLTDIVQIEFRKGGRFAALRRDGTVATVRSTGEIKNVGEPGEFVGLIEPFFATRRDGTIAPIQINSGRHWDQIGGGDAQQVTAANFQFPLSYLRFESGEWRFWTSEVHAGDAERVDSRIEAALHGAVEVQGMQVPAGTGPAQLLFALLPAETVSRSGYWEVDDLIADRQQLLENSKESPSSN